MSQRSISWSTGERDREPAQLFSRSWTMIAHSIHSRGDAHRITEPWHGHLRGPRVGELRHSDVAWSLDTGREARHPRRAPTRAMPVVCGRCQRPEDYLVQEQRRIATSWRQHQLGIYWFSVHTSSSPHEDAPRLRGVSGLTGPRALARQPAGRPRSETQFRGRPDSFVLSPPLLPPQATEPLLLGP